MVRAAGAAETLDRATRLPQDCRHAVIDLVVGALWPARIAATWPVHDIARAQEDFQSKTRAGKLVLLPAGQNDDRPKEGRRT